MGILHNAQVGVQNVLIILFCSMILLSFKRNARWEQKDAINDPLEDIWELTRCFKSEQTFETHNLSKLVFLFHSGML